MKFTGGKVRTDFQSRKSLFSKLLAQENVIVVHSSNVDTASFNLKSRVLTLPNWAETITDDVYDLFCGHETGHALHTPTARWAVDIEKTAKKLGADINQVAPFFQIIEDVRNDKLQTKKYPGLKRIYVDAYGELFSKGFFGLTGGGDIRRHFMDKVNIYYKVGPIQSKVVFDHTEWDLVNKIGDVETWNGVVKLVEETWEYCKNNPYGKTSSSNDEQDDGESRYEYQLMTNGEGSESEDTEIETFSAGEDGDAEESATEGQSEEADDSDGEGGNSSGKPGSDDDGGEESEGHSDEGAPGPAPEGSKGGKSTKAKSREIPLPVSQAIFDKKQKQSVSTKGLGVSVTVPKSWESKYDEIVFPYKKVLAVRKRNFSSMATSPVTNFLKNEKGNIDYMVKEFEMRKAADTYARSGTAKTGTLNTNKVFSYVYNEDLFKRITTVPQGTNHGLVFFLDWSGSMDQIMLPTIKQLLILVTFCRKIGVPFEVYTFLDTGSQHGVGMKLKADNYPNEFFYGGRFGLLNVLSSSMSSAEMLTAMSHLWGFKNLSSSGESLGGTPLDPAIIYSEYVIKKFKEKYRCQVVTAVFLTDGESSPMTLPNNVEFLVEPKTNQKFRLNQGRPTNAYLRYLKCRLPYVNLLGIKLVGSHSGGMTPEQKWMVKRPPATGYDSEYVIKTTTLNTHFLKFSSHDARDTEEAHEAHAERLEKEFTKGMQSVKENRPFLKAFVESMVEVKKMETETV